MATYELDISQNFEAGAESKGTGLGSDLLVNNARWFIRVRWIVAAIFAITGGLFLVFRTPLLSFGVSIPSPALFVLAVVLAAANLLFFVQSSGFSQATQIRQVKAHIWIQILFDLAIVTALVYIVGSTDTFVSFAYLFHIALACIFFPPRESLLVSLSAVALYSAVVLLELGGVIPNLGIYRLPGVELPPPELTLHLFQAATSIFVWFVVWYLVATLSGGIRRRDRQLQIINRQLVEAHTEMNQQMLVITHDLKAPFSGIESNIEVIKLRFWNELPQKVQEIIERINSRSGVLRERINSILMLGELRSQSIEGKMEVEKVDLQELLRVVCDDLRERARERDVTVHCSIEHAEVMSNKNKLRVLFENLVSNAINYSPEGRSVAISGETSGVVVNVQITDHGIGIREDALPHIFEEFFRSREAARFNRSSTGLGLAIVREIALHLRLHVSVESKEGEGTQFTLEIPITSE